jgi:hypothetical protein
LAWVPELGAVVDGAVDGVGVVVPVSGAVAVVVVGAVVVDVPVLAA